MGRLVVHVACDVPVLQPWVQRLVSSPMPQRLRIAGRAESCILLKDDVPCSPAMAAGSVYEQLQGLVSFSLVDSFVGGLVLHAGCVMRGATCVLIAGVSGAGKTTATAWFLGRGYDYLTDELVFVPFAQEQVRGWARPLHVKNGSLAWVAAQQRPAHLQPMLRYPNGAFVMPENFASRVVAAATPTHLLFVNYAQDATPEVTPLRPAQAATRLVQHLVNGRNLPNHGVPQLIELCRGLRAYQARYAHLQDVLNYLDL